MVFVVRMSTKAIRTVEHKGGVDAFLRDTAVSKLPRELRQMKRDLDKVAVAANRRNLPMKRKPAIRGLFLLRAQRILIVVYLGRYAAG